jgi:excisionase family DNA binding protein
MNKIHKSNFNNDPINKTVEQALSKQLYSKKQLTEILQISERTLERWIVEHGIQKIKMGKRVLIPKDQLKYFFTIEQMPEDDFEDTYNEICGDSNG